MLISSASVFVGTAASPSPVVGSSFPASVDTITICGSASFNSGEIIYGCFSIVCSTKAQAIVYSFSLFVFIFILMNLPKLSL